MKKYFICIFSCIILALNTACEDFLDKSPDMGLTDADIYKNYNSIRGFLDQSYTYLDNYHAFNETNNERTHIGAISDEFASIYNDAMSIPINNGNWISANITGYEIGISASEDGTKKGTSIWKAYKGLRIVNRVIRDIDKVVNISDSQKDEILGQAYFLRAWFYFQLIKRYGGMPLLDQLFVGDGTEDLPRKTYHESHDWMVADLDKAIGMLPDEWDDNNTGRPTKLAAMAVKSMAQLYDASPLMQNDLTKTEVKEYDEERAKIAAQSAYKVIEYIENPSQTQYKLMGADEQDQDKKLEIYKNIFYWPAPPYTQPEYIWYNRKKANDFKRYIVSLWLPSELSGKTGADAVPYNAPTQNMVNMFELKQSGIYRPIEDYVAHYNGSKDPFKKLDPRFNNNILYPGQEWSKDRNDKPMYITTYVDGSMYSTVKSSQHSNKRGQTGYLCKKFIWEQANIEHEAKGGYNLNTVITVYIRTAQIYLDFAEAVFEATGSATSTVEGCGGLTAEQALNKVRNRVGVTDIPSDIVGDPVKFREAYRRERAVELMFENHRWWDIRRWMIAHELFAEQYPIKGIEFYADRPLDAAEKKDPTGLTFSHKIIDVTHERRVFEMRNYWYPFSMNDVASLNNLVQTPGW